MLNYEQWRVSYQSSEQAAKAAFCRAQMPEAENQRLITLMSHQMQPPEGAPAGEYIRSKDAIKQRLSPRHLEIDVMAQSSRLLKLRR
jgi:hypothetical protein